MCWVGKKPGKMWIPQKSVVPSVNTTGHTLCRFKLGQQMNPWQPSTSAVDVVIAGENNKFTMNKTICYMSGYLFSCFNMVTMQLRQNRNKRVTSFNWKRFGAAIVMLLLALVNFTPEKATVKWCCVTNILALFGPFCSHTCSSKLKRKRKEFLCCFWLDSHHHHLNYTHLSQ